MDAETELRSRLAEGFARVREESLLEQNAQILRGLLGARGQDLGFFQGGAPQFQEGILGELIAAGGNLASTAMLRRPPPAVNPFRR